MAKRQAARAPKQGRPTATTKYWQRATALLSQRDNLMTEIAAARSHAKGPLPLINKARTLLTRFWSDASWDAREELLRTARWLVGVGKFQYAGDRPASRRGKSASTSRTRPQAAE